jgi:hypothetical protein
MGRQCPEQGIKMEALAKELMPVELEVQGPQRQQCDSCSARAFIHIYLSVGDLYFCNHHYNKHASVLHSRNARAVRIYQPEAEIDGEKL